MIEGEPDVTQDDGSPGTRHMQVRDASHFIFAPAEGLYEPRHMVGERVEAGESAGFIHFVEDFARPPIELRYPRSGVLWMVQGPGRPQKGDAIVVVMSPYEG